MKPSNAHLIHAFIITTVSNHLYEFGKAHTDAECAAEFERLSKDPDDIKLDLDSFIADQCTSKESLESFRRTFPDESISPIDVVKPAFKLIEQFSAKTIKNLKCLALIIATSAHDPFETDTADTFMALAIDEELKRIHEQAAALN